MNVDHVHIVTDDGQLERTQINLVPDVSTIGQQKFGHRDVSVHDRSEVAQVTGQWFAC